MADVAVTGYAAAFLIFMKSVDLADHRLVTTDTILLDDLSVAFLRRDGGRIIAGSESQAMVKAIEGFGEPFVDEIMRHMAVIADGYRFVAALSPGFELVAHDVTVDAGGGIIRKIGCGFGVIQGESAQPNQDTQHQGQQSTEE